MGGDVDWTCEACGKSWASSAVLSPAAAVTLESLRSRLLASVVGTVAPAEVALRTYGHVVVDEAHSYRGVFGSHVANLMRRLRRICRLYGADPVFIGASATSFEPHASFARLVGVTLTTQDDDGPTTYRLDRLAPEAPEVRIEVDRPTACPLPRLIHAPTFDAPRRVAAALESSRDDPPFRKARPHALWLLGLAGSGA